MQDNKTILQHEMRRLFLKEVQFPLQDVQHVEKRREAHREKRA
jgi:hypothetical protein